MFWKKKERALKAAAPVMHLDVVEMGSPREYAGISRSVLRISDKALPGAKLRVAVRGRENDALVVSPVEPGQFVKANIHFMLLPAGQHAVVYELTEANGAVSTLERELDVGPLSQLGEETAELLRKSNVPLVFEGECDSSYYPYSKHQAWFDRPDAEEHIAGLLQCGEIDAHDAEQLRHFVAHGYLVLEGLIDDELVDAVNTEIDEAVAQSYQGYKYGTSQRIELLHQHYPNVRKLWLDERHRRFANILFSAKARPCQTLTYVFGSQQDAHQDLVHLTPFPAGYMCGTWIALQDVVEDSGELRIDSQRCIAARTGHQNRV